MKASARVIFILGGSWNDELYQFHDTAHHFFFFQAEDGIRDLIVTGVQTCALPISQYGTAFCEAIDAREGVTTGISAYDRARTIRVAIDPATRPADLARPGHVFPLREIGRASCRERV